MKWGGSAADTHAAARAKRAALQKQRDENAAQDTRKDLDKLADEYERQAHELEREAEIKAAEEAAAKAKAAADAKAEKRRQKLERNADAIAIAKVKHKAYIERLGPETITRREAFRNDPTRVAAARTRFFAIYETEKEKAAQQAEKEMKLRDAMSSAIGDEAAGAGPTTPPPTTIPDVSSIVHIHATHFHRTAHNEDSDDNELGDWLDAKPGDETYPDESDDDDDDDIDEWVEVARLV